MLNLLNKNNTLTNKFMKMMSILTLLLISGCGVLGGHEQLPSAQFVSSNEGPGPQYIIGPLDSLEIFVWRFPELSSTVFVRPDGRLSVPLIDDLAATGKTPTQLARDMEEQLSQYVESPVVSVIVNGFQGPFTQQIRVVGSATAPQAIPYRANMTLLDVMIVVGGMTEFASGNRSTLARVEGTGQKEYTIRLDDLLKDGDVSANVTIEPGDVIIIPESIF